MTEPSITVDVRLRVTLGDGHGIYAPLVEAMKANPHLVAEWLPHAIAVGAKHVHFPRLQAALGSGEGFLTLITPGLAALDPPALRSLASVGVPATVIGLAEALRLEVVRAVAVADPTDSAQESLVQTP